MSAPLGRTPRRAPPGARSQWRRDRRRLRQRKVWTLPVTLLGCALLLSWALPALDRSLHHLEQRYGEKLFPLLDSGGMAALLGAIAGGMITLTGLVFTATTLAMQYGATQLSVRVVPMLQQDRVMRWATGTFMATFLYSLLIAIRLAVRQSDYRPVLSTFFALGLTVVCACLFFAVVARVGQVLNSSALLRWVAGQGRRAVGRLRPPVTGPLPPSDPDPVEITLDHSPRTGQVLLACNEARLRRLAAEWGVGLELCACPGDFVALRSTVFLVHGPADRVDARRLLGCLLFAECYSPEADPAGALRTLVDVALKALSPAVNDPTRAVQAVDHIEDLLVLLQPLAPSGSGLVGDALLRLPVRTWADYVCAGTDEIRHFSADSMQVQRRLRALFERLAWLCSADQAVALRVRLAALDDKAGRHWSQALDRRLAGHPDAQGLGSEAGTDRPPSPAPGAAGLPGAQG
ncbi:DUF2254 domain-containing protein [Streptacidiphilus sp. PB12-B1b]|uniref:DUF2254 domain-containing protein n=1 Tax=Streptacidiphilus sp. PB12-B1b TaxID=2705012 RepID=UPI0015FC654E|nr:DUF2254 domain-containing protein [Streptacidiphilus sp. PB12-B1b]QMU76096.1 DUF2254 domain-containing protein [Streptacidiphilus sp. PB12-B1b]